MLTSLGPLSSLNFHQADAQYIDRGDYLVVKTPTRPHFFWGNFITFKKPAKAQDFKWWIESYRKEFDVEKQGYMTMTWDSSQRGEVQDFLDFGFSIDDQYVLELKTLNDPSIHQSKLIVRPIESEDDWKQVYKTQWIHDWPLKESQDNFLKDKIATYRRLQDQGFGKRFGAFENGVLLGDLGIYCRDGIGRFNNVCTLSTHYNQGVCRTLVYESSKWALDYLGVNRLVLEASKTNYAYLIYQKVGYEIVGSSYEMTWLKPELVV